MNHPLGHKLKEGIPMDAAGVLNEAAHLGVNIELDGDELRVVGGRDAVAELVPMLRLHKPSIVRLLAQRSAANDSQPAAVDHPPPPPPAPALTHAEWATLDKAYQAHHFGCPTCIAAGKGYGLRCGTGAALWAEYDRATEPARTTQARKDVRQ